MKAKNSYAHHVLRRAVVAVVIASSGFMATQARAQSQASEELSALSVASIVGSATVVGVAVGAVVVLPVALMMSGATLVVTAVQASGDATVYALERVSDGAKVSVRVVRRAGEASAVGVGTSVLVTGFVAGTVLSAAGEVLAYLPNTLGRALLSNEEVI